MANEILFSGDLGQTYFICLRRVLDFYVWYDTGTVFEAWGTGGRDQSDYGMEATYQGGGVLTVDAPGSLAAGRYLVQTFRQYGDDPADDDTFDGAFVFEWDGSQQILFNVDGIDRSNDAAKSLARSAAIRGNKAKQNKFTGELTIRNADDSEDLLTVNFTDDGTEITRSIESM